MARNLKTRGLVEVATLKARVLRQHSLEKISRKDRDKLVDLLDQFEAHVIKMDEVPERGQIRKKMF